MSMASKFEFSKKSDVSKGRPPPVINRKAPEKNVNINILLLQLSRFDVKKLFQFLIAGPLH